VEATSVVALVIAGISGASSVYAVVTSRRALKLQQSQLETKASIRTVHTAEERPGPIIIDMNRPARDPGKYYQVAIDVVNDGETVEYVTRLLADTPDATDLKEYELRQDAELKPHARITVTTSADGLPEKGNSGFVVKALLANGKKIESEVIPLNPDVLDEVETYNRKVGA
jgi:hypothetical protein